MHATDPLLPYWFLACSIIGFGFGLIAGRLTSRRRRKLPGKYQLP